MTFTLKHKRSDFPYKSPLKKINLENNSQGLSKKALLAKRKRDKAAAMTGDRKKKKRENQADGQNGHSDIHHKSDGSTERVSVHANRGNFGKGTKIEG
tara:strand:+ start:169 stop:462 length:294 start_codon:yes stop_codon:yes gene_type:complete